MRRIGMVCVLSFLWVSAVRAELIDVAGTPVLKSPAVLVSGSETVPAGEKIRVGFYNIENFGDGEGDGKNRSPELAAAQARLAAGILDEIDADVLMVCEIENSTSAKLLNTALSRPFPSGWISVFSAGGGPEKLNIAAFSRLGPAECAEIDFGTLIGPGKPPRGALRLRIDLDASHTLLVYAVHLKSNYGKVRRNQILRENVMRIVRENADQMMASDAARSWEVLVVGDMNFDPSQAQFKGDNSLKPFADWTDLWMVDPEGQEVTLPYRAASQFVYDPATFDRMLASPALNDSPWKVGSPTAIPKGVNTQGATTNPGEDNHVSDHYPVFVDIAR